MTSQKPRVGREKCVQQRELREPQRLSQSNTTRRRGGALHSDRGRADVTTQVLASDFCSIEYWTECLVLLLFVRCDLGFIRTYPDVQKGSQQLSSFDSWPVILSLLLSQRNRRQDAGFQQPTVSSQLRVNQLPQKEHSVPWIPTSPHSPPLQRWAFYISVQLMIHRIFRSWPVVANRCFNSQSLLTHTVWLMRLHNPDINSYNDKLLSQGCSLHPAWIFSLTGFELTSRRHRGLNIERMLRQSMQAVLGPICVIHCVFVVFLPVKLLFVCDSSSLSFPLFCSSTVFSDLPQGSICLKLCLLPFHPTAIISADPLKGVDQSLDVSSPLWSRHPALHSRRQLLVWRQSSWHWARKRRNKLIRKH